MLLHFNILVQKNKVRCSISDGCWNFINKFNVCCRSKKTDKDNIEMVKCKAYDTVKMSNTNHSLKTDGEYETIEL